LIGCVTFVCCNAVVGCNAIGRFLSNNIGKLFCDTVVGCNAIGRFLCNNIGRLEFFDGFATGVALYTGLALYTGFALHTIVALHTTGFVPIKGTTQLLK
jgi:hypothetical protein